MDLLHPDARGMSRNIRFIRRVFVPDEQERIIRARCPDSLLWSMWAAKEAAYKITSKIHPGVSSAPNLYRVSYDGETEETMTGQDGYAFGSVGTPCGTVVIKSLVNRDYVHCIGVDGTPADIQAVVWDVDQIIRDGKPAADNESFFIREKAGKRLSAYLNADPAEIDIRRRRRGASGLGPPRVFCRGRRAEIDISLSHDGRFAAYAFARSDLTGGAPACPAL
ncbi:MAG: 4-phosphopantetheinyl transferase family protein [Deltaproteobacteria bacterium]|nr:4-phosphopantetheinyl transferase family protein [Deltaproteobacteria bacterium]